MPRLLRVCLVLLLTLAVPLHAIAALAPVLQPHAHAAGMPEHAHLAHLHPDGVKLHSIAGEADGAPAGTVLDEHDTGLCAAPAAPLAAGPALAHDLGNEAPAARPVHASTHVPEQPVRPPRA